MSAMIVSFPMIHMHIRVSLFLVGKFIWSTTSRAKQTWIAIFRLIFLFNTHNTQHTNTMYALATRCGFCTKLHHSQFFIFHTYSATVSVSLARSQSLLHKCSTTLKLNEKKNVPLLLPLVSNWSSWIILFKIYVYFFFASSLSTCE